MKKITAFVAMIFVLTAVYVCAQDSDRILVKVNDEIIMQSEVDEALETAATQLKLAGKPADTKDLAKKIEDGLVEQKLIITMAKDESIVVSDEAVADKVNEYLDGLRSKFANEQAFEDALQQEGLSYTDFRIKIEAQVKDSLIYGKVKQKKQQDFINKAAVTDSELASYFDKNKDMFNLDNKITIAQIRFSKGEVVTDNFAKYVKDISARIKTDGFEKVSAELAGKKGVSTIDPIEVDMASLDKRIVNAVKNPKKGKVSEPVEIPASDKDNGGFVIIKVTDYKGGKEPKFDDVKEKVRVKIIEEKVDQMWSDWMETVKKEAYIQYM
jgi:hypothetical protein